MTTRLIQIVAFANVAPSATATLPHQINLNGVAQAPDFVAADGGGFSIAVTTTNVSVTNNGTSPADVNIWLELKHSISRELGKGFGDPFESLVPRPFVASGGGSGVGKAIVVYAPGIANTTAPYYNTWADVETAVNAVNGACQLWIDMTGLSGFAQVPATANLDGQGRLEIIGKGPQGEAELVMADGAQIKNVQTFRTIVFRGRGNTRPPLLWDLDGMIVECLDATFLFDLVCTQPVMRLAVASYISFFFSHSSELRNSHNPGAAVLDIGPGVQCFLCIDTLDFPSSFDTTISGPVGSTLQLQIDGSVQPSFTLPAFLGTLTVDNIDHNLGQAGGVLGFYGVPPSAQPTVAGSRGGNAALASLLTALANLGLIVDGSSP